MYKKLEYEIDPDSKCWIVCSHKPNGTGYIYINKVYDKDYAHRLIYREIYGDIPPRSEIRHKCGNKKCINPEHLVLFNLEERCYLEN